MATVYGDRGFGVRPTVFYNRSNEAARQLRPGIRFSAKVPAGLIPAASSSSGIYVNLREASSCSSSKSLL